MVDTASYESLTEAQKKRIRSTVEELNGSMTRIESEKTFQKEAIDDLFDEVKIDKALVKKIASTYFKSSYQKDNEDREEFQKFYVGILHPTE